MKPLIRPQKHNIGNSLIKVETFHEISDISEKYKNEGIDKINSYLNRLRND